VRRPRVWLVAIAAGLSVVSVVVAFGLTTRAGTIVAVGVAAAVAGWALLRLRTEREEHEAASASWADPPWV
jgi:Flp pilus assembly protein TadB